MQAYTGAAVYSDSVVAMGGWVTASDVNASHSTRGGGGGHGVGVSTDA